MVMMILNSQTVCFYYRFAMNFREMEFYFVLAFLVFLVCLFACYLLCTKRISSHSMIHLDRLIDPDLARETELKLAPEPM